jgi:hypothetical protein
MIQLTVLYNLIFLYNGLLWANHFPYALLDLLNLYSMMCVCFLVEKNVRSLNRIYVSRTFFHSGPSVSLVIILYIEIGSSTSSFVINQRISFFFACVYGERERGRRNNDVQCSCYSR